MSACLPVSVVLCSWPSLSVTCHRGRRREGTRHAAAGAVSWARGRSAAAPAGSRRRRPWRGRGPESAAIHAEDPPVRSMAPSSMPVSGRVRGRQCNSTAGQCGRMLDPRICSSWSRPAPARRVGPGAARSVGAGCRVHHLSFAGFGGRLPPTGGLSAAVTATTTPESVASCTRRRRMTGNTSPTDGLSASAQHCRRWRMLARRLDRVDALGGSAPPAFSHTRRNGVVSRRRPPRPRRRVRELRVAP
jgi:hypothetical protein